MSTATLSPSIPMGDWTCLPSFIPVPDMGVLAVNAFLLKGRQPLLVDTGIAAAGDAFLDALRLLVDPQDLRWIWLSHLDPDHIGNLERVLAAAPQATVITSFLGAGKLRLTGMEIERMRLIEPGVPLDIGDRQLMPLRPPYYDAPETLGLFDPRDRVLFAADSFGAVLPQPVERFEDIDPSDLAAGLRAWSSLDAPWLRHVDGGRFGRQLAAVEALAPAITLTGHLPPLHGDVVRLTTPVHAAWCAPSRQHADDPLDIASVAAALAARPVVAAQ